MPIGGSTVQDAVPVPIQLTNSDVADVMAALQKQVAPAAQDIVSGKNSDAMGANQNEGLLTTRNKMSTKNSTTNQNNRTSNFELRQNKKLHDHLMEIPTQLGITVVNTQKCLMQTQLKTAYLNLLEPEESLKLNAMDLKRSTKEGTSSARFVMCTNHLLTNVMHITMNSTMPNSGTSI